MQSSWLIFLFSHLVVENRTFFGYSWHFCYHSKQNKLLSEKLEINYSRKFLFQKWGFCFLLPLMMQHNSHFIGIQLLFSILAYIHILSILGYSVVFLLQVFRNTDDWRVIRLFHEGILEGIFVQA